MQPRIWLAFWTGSAHCWLILSFSSTSTPKSSSGLLSSYSPPSLYLCLGLPRPTCRTLHLALLNFMLFTQAHLSSHPSEWHLFPPACQPHHTTWCHRQNYCQCTVPLSMSPTKTAPAPVPTPEHTTCHWSPPGHRAFDCNSLCASIKPVPYPASGPSVKSMSFHFIMQDSVECLSQVQVDDVSCPPFVHQCCNPITEGYQVGQARFALGEAMLAVPSQLLVIHVP